MADSARLRLYGSAASFICVMLALAPGGALALFTFTGGTHVTPPAAPPAPPAPHQGFKVPAATAAHARGEAISQAGGWKQSRFVSSFWMDPMVDVSEFPMRYRQIADANFTLVMSGFGATTPSSRSAQVEACRDNDVSLPR